MKVKNKTLEGLVEFLPLSDMNGHGKVIASVVENMAAKILENNMLPAIPLEDAFKDLAVNVITTSEGHNISLECKDISIRRYIELLLLGLDHLLGGSNGLQMDIKLRVSVPKKMPIVERNILFDYLDSIFGKLMNLDAFYVNADKIVVSESNGIKFMAYA